MLKLLLKPEAENDLIKIFEYTAIRWGIGQAVKYQDEMYEGMKLLLKQKNLGKEYSYSELSYRKIHINRHLIFYRTEEQKCVVVRILHDSMEIKTQLEKK